MFMLKRIQHLFSTVPAIWAMAAMLAGCMDDPIYESVDIPNAEVEVQGEVIYKPLVSTKVQTRATEAPAGDKYTDIQSLYVFFFDRDSLLVPDYSGAVEFQNADNKPDNSDKRVTFKKKVKAGEYYVYAVVNVPADKLTEVKKIEDLRKVKLTWDNDIKDNLEMFGVFHNDYQEGDAFPNNNSFEEDALITILPTHKTLHSWVRRAVSKVTVDFNGNQLKEGVTVYIKDAVLKNLASGAFLGADSRIDSDTFQIAENTDYSITYGTGDDHKSWPNVTKSKTFKAKEIWSEAGIENFHDDNAKALPCYENMQGTPEGKSKFQDKDGDGKIDKEDYDGVPNGTYLEVKGYYVADVEGYKSQGDIVYRFMLGQDAKNNFDLIRNHHYKITMNFRDYGNDVDWHIEYSDQYFDVTFPEDVNYQGKFFVPSPEFKTIPNGGHTFSDQNEITVTSFKTNGTENEWIEPKIEYTYYTYDFRNDNWNPVDGEGGNWLETSEGELINDKTQKKYTFVASKTDSVTININEKLRDHLAVSGSENSPYNLSNKNGGMNVENTANCYIVGAPGWYCFPLVYGNAIADGGTNSAAYTSPNIVNHLNKNITNPYIKENGVNISKENVSVEIIWKDDKNIVRRKKDGGTLEYDANLFGGKGGIKFEIKSGDIKECNFVVALIDKSAKEDELVKCERDYWPYNSLYEEKGNHFGSTKAIWSWHIWVTRFGFEEEEFAKDIPVLNHERKEFDVMPVNLGWCSGGKEFRYYKPRKCDITFTVGDLKIQRTIIQYPHLLLPRGDHPYYQWGRKDPFIGTNKLWTNKQRWSTVVNPDGSEFDFLGEDNKSASNPTFLYYNAPTKDFVGNEHRNDSRKNTIDCLAELVKNPDKWHNCKHGTTTTNPGESLNYYTMNVAPSDLWLYNNAKTVYDPCPPGYEVGRGVFTGFTTDGGNQTSPGYWYDVLESNMETYYYGYETGDREKVRPINGYVIDVYTDTRKLQSITFPITGYRDWDAWAEVVHYPPTLNQYNDKLGQNLEGRGFAWTSEAEDAKGSYYLAFCRKDIQPDRPQPGWLNGRGGGDEKMWINPRLGGPNTDGYAVRPVSSESKRKANIQ